jgi:hypothetical protein
MNMCIHYIVAWLIYLQNLGGSKEVSYWLSCCVVVDGQMIMADQIRRLVRPYHDIYWSSNKRDKANAIYAGMSWMLSP